MEALDLLSLVIRLKVIFFGHFGLQFRRWFALPRIIQKLDPQDQTLPGLQHIVDIIKPTLWKKLA